MKNDQLEEYQLKIIEILKRDYFIEEQVVKLIVIIINNLIKECIEIRIEGKVICIFVENLFKKGYTEEATAQEIYEILLNKKQ